MLPLELLQWRLAETIQWCTPRINITDPASSLRSPELNPLLNINPFDNYLSVQEAKKYWDVRHENTFGTQAYADARNGVFQTAVAKVAIKRAALLAQEGFYPTTPIEKIKEGRLLLFFPNSSTSDGAAPLNSDELFDLDDIPPWDTWVGFLLADKPEPFCSIQACLVSWIPDQYIKLVASAINHISDGCLVWADDPYDFVRRDLEKYGIWPLLASFKV